MGKKDKKVTGAKRDVTKALHTVATLRLSIAATAGALAKLEKLLRAIDARTGRRDPSVRKAAKKK